MTLLKYYENAKFNNEPEKAIKQTIETKDPTCVEAFCKKEIELLNNFGKITGVLRFLADLVSGIDQSFRYPNINGGDSPLDLYSAESVIINELPCFIEKLEIVNKGLYECANELSNRKVS